MKRIVWSLALGSFSLFGDVSPLAAVPWLGDGKPLREGAAWYAEDPAPVFRAPFVAPPGARTVRLRLACAGYAALRVNGRTLLTGLEAPWSVYDKTVYVQTLDVPVRPAPATNDLAVALGNGFYNLPPLRFWGHREFYRVVARGRPCFKLAVDGLAAPLAWTWRETNILGNSVYLGTELDARRGAGGAARPAVAVPGPRGVCVPWPGGRAPCAYGAAETGHALPGGPSGAQVLDFATNATAVPTFRFRGEAPGTRIEILYGERLHADESVNVLTQTAGQIKRAGKGGPGAPDVAAQRDVYVCRGGDESFTPPFTWHVFRYAEVRGAAHPVAEAARRTLSCLGAPRPEAAAFRPRHPAFGALHAIAQRTFRANLVGLVQSDCPGRERLGYGGDIVATCDAYMLNWDMREIYLKILRDFADEAADDGWLTETAPYVGIAVRGFGGRSGPISWTVAVPVVMEALIRHYPDVADRALAFYPVCARYARLVDAKCPDGLVPACIGDHEALERAPDAVTATAHWHHFACLTASFAQRLGRTDDAAFFSALAAKIRAAFAARFVQDGVVANGSQSAQAIALQLGLVPEAQVPAAEAALLAAVEKAGYAPTTGIFGTRYLLTYLSEHGRRDVAEKIVLHEGFPGWRHMLARGATTLWETWKESDDVYSNCHPMFGSVDEWILRFGGAAER